MGLALTSYSSASFAMARASTTILPCARAQDVIPTMLYQLSNNTPSISLFHFDIIGQPFLAFQRILETTYAMGVPS